jgi:hypothetical protein
MGLRDKCTETYVECDHPFQGFLNVINPSIFRDVQGISDHLKIKSEKVHSIVEI